MTAFPLTYYKFGEKTISRFVVPKDKKNWTIEWSQYKPTQFEVDFEGKDWADPKIEWEVISYIYLLLHRIEDQININFKTLVDI